MKVSVQQQRRRTLVAAADAVVWILGMVFAVALRLEFDLPPGGWIATIGLGVVAAILQLIAGFGLGLYRGRYAYGSFSEVRALGLTVAGIAILLSLFVIPFGNAVHVPRGTVLLAAPFVLVVMFGIRYVARATVERSRKPADDAEPTLIAGAGYLGDRLLHSIITDPTSPIRPVGLLDDDPAKKHLVLRGVPVLGRTAQLAAVAQQTGATRVIIAMGSADSVQLREWSDQADAAGVAVSVTPSLTDMMLDPGGVDVRDIEIEDLIGRHPVDTNVELIAGYVAGKRVLVTGAGGSIGSELCRQLSKFGPAELIMLDRDETGLQQAQLGTAGHGLLDTKDVVLANIR
ncbi:MAG: polysaccharide biosynthesis protein, partial [Microbacterium sp.]|nr:polysaccharide biosynthesis protein [Microbacterium sp.]